MTLLRVQGYLCLAFGVAEIVVNLFGPMIHMVNSNPLTPTENAVQIAVGLICIAVDDIRKKIK